MSKQQILIGTLVKIDLLDGRCAFGRIISKSELAFYGIKVPCDQDFPADQVYAAPIAFIVPVMNSAVKTGRWKAIDRRPLEDQFLASRDYFMRDQATGAYSIYHSDDGSTRPATAAECNGLERAAVWEPEHVEDRLRDYFDGKVNKWETQLKT